MNDLRIGELIERLATGEVEDMEEHLINVNIVLTNKVGKQMINAEFIRLAIDCAKKEGDERKEIVQKLNKYHR